MCKRVIEENRGMSELVPDEYKTQDMGVRDVEDDPYMLEFVPRMYKIEEMCKQL